MFHTRLIIAVAGRIVAPTMAPARPPISAVRVSPRIRPLLHPAQAVEHAARERGRREGGNGAKVLLRRVLPASGFERGFRDVHMKRNARVCQRAPLTCFEPDQTQEFGNLALLPLAAGANVAKSMCRGPNYWETLSTPALLNHACLGAHCMPDLGPSCAGLAAAAPHWRRAACRAWCGTLTTASVPIFPPI